MQDWKHHVLQLHRLAKHLHQLNQTVIWVDINPMTYAVHGAPALKCALNVNAAAHEQVTQLACDPCSLLLTLPAVPAFSTKELDSPIRDSHQCPL